MKRLTFRRANRGQGFVEFALILPLLLLFLFGVIEFGRMFVIYNGASNAAREAARWGSVVGSTSGGVRYFFDCAGMKAAAQRTASLASLTSIEIVYEAPDTADGTFDEIGFCDESDTPRNLADTADLETSDLNNGYRIKITVVSRFTPILPLLPIPQRDFTAEAARTIYTNIEGAPQCNDGIDNDYDDEDNDGIDYALLGGDSDCESLNDKTEGEDLSADSCYVLNVVVQNTDIPTGLMGTATLADNIELSPSSSGGCDEGEYTYNAVVTLTALDVGGNQWQSWTGTDTNTASTTIFMNGNRTAVAYFAGIQCYTLTLNYTGSGSTPVTSPGPDCNGGTQYTYGADLLVTGTPATNYYLSSWSGALTGTTNPSSYTVTGAATITANYSSSTECHRLFITKGGDLPGSYNTSDLKAAMTYSPASANCLTSGGPAWSGRGSVTVTAPATITHSGITYVFSSWSGEVSNTSNTVVIPMTERRDVVANYARCYQLNYDYDSLKGYVSVYPTSAGGCSALTYTSGTVVKLYPVGEAGYSFSGWTGDDVPSGDQNDNPLQLTMTDDYLDITANFAVSNGCYRLSLDENPVGSTVVLSAVSPAPSCTTAGGQAGYPVNTTVLFTVEPETGYTFNYWSYGSSTDAQQTTQVRMTSDITATAYLTAPCYTFTTNILPEGGGSVTHALDATSTATTCTTSGGGLGYYPNAIVRITAAPNVGYLFGEWSGASESSEASTTVTALGNVTVTANFVATNYTLNVCIESGTGSVTIASSGASTSATGACVSAEYGANMPDVQFSAAGGGGTGFIQWVDENGALLSTDSTESITMSGDKTYRAVFDVCYLVNFAGLANGSVAVTSASQPVCSNGGYPNGSTVGLTATPNSGYKVTGWSGVDSSSGDTASLTVNGDETVSATFATECYTLQLAKSPSTAVPTPSATTATNCTTSGGQAGYAYGTSVTLNASSATGWTHSGWSSSPATAVFSGHTFTMPDLTDGGALTVTAAYALSCPTVSSGPSIPVSGGDDRKKITWTILNGTGATRILRTLVSSSWTGGNLDKITVGGVTVYNPGGSGISPTALSAQNPTALTTYTLNAGASVNVVIDFKQQITANSFIPDFQFVFRFSDSVSTSNTCNLALEGNVP